MVKIINNKINCCFLFLFFFISSYAYSEDQVWVKDIDTGLEKARNEKKPVLVFVTASWCSYCTMMHNTTLTSPEILTAIAPFIKVEIDYDKNQEFRSKWDIEGIPVLLLFNQFGEYVDRSVGFKNPKDFSAWLVKNKEKSHGTQSIKSLEESKIQLILKTYLEADPENRDGIFAALLTSSFSQKDKELKEFINKKIIEIIQINPTYFIKLLDHSHLEARILAANIIEILKLDFIFDPWADFQTRREQIQIIIPKTDKLKEKPKLKSGLEK